MQLVTDGLLLQRTKDRRFWNDFLEVRILSVSVMVAITTLAASSEVERASLPSVFEETSKCPFPNNE